MVFLYSESEFVSVYEQANNNIARIFNDIVNEPRLTPERPRRLQLSRVVDDVVKLLQYQLRQDVRVA
jgi:hypothetical protein